MAEPVQSYDYIVIGAGSAGCAVAGRLGEANKSVLLLEAGGPVRTPWIPIPLGYAKLYANPSLNWGYTTEPEPHLNTRRLFQPRGKVLGGTAAINGMIYMRGQAQDFDNWAAQGCVGWDWDSVLSYFRSCEDQERGPDAYHGVGGPVSVSDLPSRHALGEAFHGASERFGAPRNPDFNGATQLGTGYVQTTTRKGRRWTTASGYLRGVAKQNINVVLHALVARIVLDGKRAVGVVWRDKSGRREARARGEVILCGGTFNSPQLLQLSGIGPASVLKARGIEVAHELSGVGENLQDHFGIGLQCQSRCKTTVNDCNPVRGGCAFRYLLFRTGPFAAAGIIRTPSSTAHDIRPRHDGDLHGLVHKEDLTPFLSPDSRSLPSTCARIRGRSGEKRGPPPPEILFSFFASEADGRAAVAGLNARKIAQTAPVRLRKARSPPALMSALTNR